MKAIILLLHVANRKIIKEILMVLNPESSVQFVMFLENLDLMNPMSVFSNSLSVTAKGLRAHRHQIKLPGSPAKLKQFWSDIYSA